MSVSTHADPLRFTLLFLILVVVAAADLLVGAGSLSDPAMGSAVFHLRLGRLGAAALAGAALAVGGVLAQGLLRNPLASPDVIGTTAGASLGAQTALAVLAAAGLLGNLPSWIGPVLVLPLAALVGGLAALALVLVLAKGSARLGEGLTAVLVAGFVVNALAMSGSALITTLNRGDWELGRALVEFSLGRLATAGPEHVALALPLVVAGTFAGWAWGRQLDLLQSGEDEATALGADPVAVQRWTLVWIAVLTTAAVAAGGAVAFVGLVVPHLLRGWIGSGHRRLIPAAALGGASFLVTCDLLARAIPLLAISGFGDRSELPLGVVTGLIGAPLFLLLLVRLRRQGEA
ncbi:ABC transporter permease [Planctomycetota bacterium]|nr:ABC transporter permease [Planctomycetota bacterium]